MTSAIDPTVPVVGTPTTASVRANFQTAHDEITALQGAMPAASSTPPTMNGTAAVGTGTTYARADHVHPSDTSRQTAAQVTAAVVPALNNVGRNLIHNPLFNIAQRGAGPFTGAGGTLDRWLLNLVVAGTNTITQAVLTDTNRSNIGDEAATYCLQNTFVGSSTPGAYSYMGHAIEGVRRLAGKTVTVSFWANAGSALKVGVNLFQSFGSGGSASTGAWVLTTGAAVSIPGTTFARCSVLIAVPSSMGKTLGTNGDDYTQLALWYSAASGGQNVLAGNIGVQSGMINFWGVQLEVGSIATPLEKPDPRYDLSNCQRFFYIGQVVLAGYQTAGSGIYAPASLPVTMRAFPTLASGTTANANVGAITWISAYNTVIASTVATATNPFIVNTIFTASAEL